MACTKCGCKKFYGHQRVYMTVIVNEHGTYLDDAEDAVFDADNPYGPYTCMECGEEYDELPKE